MKPGDLVQTNDEYRKFFMGEFKYGVVIGAPRNSSDAHPLIRVLPLGLNNRVRGRGQSRPIGSVVVSPTSYSAHFWEPAQIGYHMVPYLKPHHWEELRRLFPVIAKAYPSHAANPDPDPIPAQELVDRVHRLNEEGTLQAAIDASHPVVLETDLCYRADSLAMGLIHLRHDKREIVNLIRWLLLGAPATPSLTPSGEPESPGGGILPPSPGQTLTPS